MKRLFLILLAVCLICGCSAREAVLETPSTESLSETIPQQTMPLVNQETVQIPYVSRFDRITEVKLSNAGISVDGEGETDTVYTSNDIIYYEDKDAYDSGNPYGAGENSERHSSEEAAEHLVVNITAAGAYRITGQLSKGQIRIDLGEEAYQDPNAVVELILQDAEITCTVAPAVLFLNVYECDGNWSAETAKAEVDTTNAGANLILEGSNTVSGSHVAKIFKDKEGEKKLWKQDGAIYSYMSMNVYGPGKLDLTADNEGLDTELHLTINGGNVAIRADNDGINTNEDGVSVTTINGGELHIMAGLGFEGDGIDSNGWLVINGGTVISAANPGADAGLDSDLGSYINGGTVIAMGSTMDWAESESKQVTMNLQFAENQSSDAAVVITRQDGTVIFAYDPGDDEVLAENKRVYSGAVVSCANFHVGETYHVYVDGKITGEDLAGVYDVTTVTSYTDGIPMAYTGTDVRRHPAGMGGWENMPEDFDPSQLPDGVKNPGNMETNTRPEPPEGMKPGQIPEGMEAFPSGEMPEGMEPPEGFGEGQMPQDRPGMPIPGEGMSAEESGDPQIDFFMQDQVNFFSGLAKQ